MLKTKKDKDGQKELYCVVPSSLFDVCLINAKFSVFSFVFMSMIVLQTDDKFIVISGVARLFVDRERQKKKNGGPNRNYGFAKKKKSQLFTEFKFVFVSNLRFVEHLKYSFCCHLRLCSPEQWYHSHHPSYAFLLIFILL